MKKIRSIFLIVGFVTVALHLFADSTDDQFVKFLNRYSCSQEIEDHLTEREDRFNQMIELLKKDKQNQEIVSFSAPRFFLKGTEFDRLVNAERLRRFILDRKLESIGIPEKCWSKKFKKVVSTAVSQDNVYTGNQDADNKEISISEVKEFFKVAEEAGFWDWHKRNVLYDKTQKKYFIIDTEDRSFKESALVCLGKLKYGGLRFTAEADQWLQEKMMEFSQDREIRSLRYNSKYDDPDIDFNKVKDRL